MAQSGRRIKPVLGIAPLTVIGQLGQIGCFVHWVKIGVDKFQIGGTEASAREKAAFKRGGNGVRRNSIVPKTGGHTGPRGFRFARGTLGASIAAPI